MGLDSEWIQIRMLFFSKQCIYTRTRDAKINLYAEMNRNLNMKLNTIIVE